MRLWQLLLLLLSISARIKGYTHWVVKENGKIQSKVDTPFRLSRHHDLISLLDQEHRHREISILFDDLIERRKDIDLKTSSLIGPSEVESRVFSQNPECQSPTALRLDSIDFYSYIWVVNGSMADYKVDLIDDLKGMPQTLDCRDYGTINFSVFAYDHMPTMIKRREFKVTPSKDKVDKLKNVMPVRNMERFGREIVSGLRKNSSSWIHYNWGTLYWWMHGDGHMALECTRKALYYVPRLYEHIPLLNLASLLHQGGRSEAETIILLQSALDFIDPEHTLQLDRDGLGPMIALALAHVYAARADFNTSATYLDGYLRAKPQDERARSIRQAITCHRSVEEHLQSLLINMQGLLADLHTYHAKQQAWLRLHERSSWEQAPGPDLLSSLSSLTSAANLAQIQTKQFFLSDTQLMNVATQRCIHTNRDDSDNFAKGISCEMVDLGGDVVAGMKYGNGEYLSQLVKLAEEQMEKIESTLSMSGYVRRVGGIRKGRGKGKRVRFSTIQSVEETPEMYGVITTLEDINVAAAVGKVAVDEEVNQEMTKQKSSTNKKKERSKPPKMPEEYGNGEYLSELVRLAEDQIKELERTLNIDLTVENVAVEEVVNGPSEDPNKQISAATNKKKEKSKPKMPERLDEKYPVKGTVSVVDGNMYFDSTEWPSIEDCVRWNLPLDDLDDLDLPIFMPPENKGFQVIPMLSDYINVPLNIEHPLPWHPPHCEYTFKDDVTAKLLAAHDQRTKVLQSQPHAKIYAFLRNYSGIEHNGEELQEVGENGYAEIGQRIFSALKQKSGPSYVLKTIASLYWRAKNNAMNALSCLNSDLSDVPNEHQDMLFVSIGSLLHHLGYVDKALQYAKAAFKINYAEPSTNFLLALLYCQRNNPILAKHYIRNVLRADPAYYNGQAERLLRTWACRVKTGKYTDRGEQSTTTEVEVEEEEEERKVNKKTTTTERGTRRMVVLPDMYVSEKVDKISEMIREKEERVEELKKERVGTTALKRGDVSGKYPDVRECIIRRKKINAIKRNGKLPEARCTLGEEFCSSEEMKSMDRSAIDTLVLSMDNDGPPHSSEPPPEPDQSQLESLIESTSNSARDSQQYYIKIPTDFFSAEPKNLGKFYITASISDDGNLEEIFHIVDNSGSYPLSHKGCKIIQGSDWMQFPSLWQSIAKRDFNVGKFLKPLTKHSSASMPTCSVDLPKSGQTLDHLTSMVLRHRLPNDVPESYLSEWLALITGDRDSSINDIGTKLSLALQENGTSWILATAAALYWRVIGNTEAAVNCLRQALTYVPTHMKDIPLINLANVLNRIGFHADALEVTYLALDSQPHFVINHFTAGNIYNSIGDIGNAILFYRASLNIDANFEPARNRLHAILCTLLFEETE